MLDLSKTIAPKSDQLNADDLIAGEKTITITDVKINNDPAQKVSIYFEGDNGKPWKPCLTARRVLIELWGTDGLKYVGRQVTLYRDNTVKWAGEEIGGIRIRAMSDIDAAKNIVVTVSKGKRSRIRIEALETKKLNQITNEQFEELKAAIAEAKTMPELQKVAAKIKALDLDAESKSKVMPIYQEKLTELKK
jgi:hypothetical protein